MKKWEVSIRNAEANLDVIVIESEYCLVEDSILTFFNKVKESTSDGIEIDLVSAFQDWVYVKEVK
jgi:hypothetical protein